MAGERIRSMAAEDALNTQQFEGRGWTPTQVRNMASLARSNQIAKQRRAGKPSPFGPGVMERQPIRSPQNWY